MQHSFLLATGHILYVKVPTFVLVCKKTMHRNVGFWFVVVHYLLSSFFAALRVK